MNIRHKRGFTIIELMITLVVAGLLMTVLVTVSSSVERSFGQSKEIIELQSNLRFAMKHLSEDFARAAFMYSPDAAQDCYRFGEAPAGGTAAVAYLQAGPEITLRGNYISSRDYLIDLNSEEIVCRNEAKFDPVQNCGVSAEYDPYLKPFADGPQFDDVFCVGQNVRLDVEDGFFSYHLVNSVTAGGMGVVLADVNRNRIKGRYRWISPVTAVTYEVVNHGPDPLYPASGLFGLQRTTTDCRGAGATEIAEALLDPAGAPSGFSVQYTNDVAPGAAYCRDAWPPQITAAPVLAVADGDLDPLRVRAVTITLRGRTPTEDPGLLALHPDHSVDLDNDADSGLAHVRTERTVVEMHNLTSNVGK